MRTYYVVYFANNIMGSCALTCKKKVKYYNQLELFKDYISKEYCNGKNVIIINWKPIKLLKKVLK